MLWSCRNEILLSGSAADSAECTANQSILPDYSFVAPPASERDAREIVNVNANDHITYSFIAKDIHSHSFPYTKGFSEQSLSGADSHSAKLELGNPGSGLADHTDNKPDGHTKWLSGGTMSDLGKIGGLPGSAVSIDDAPQVAIMFLLMVVCVWAVRYLRRHAAHTSSAAPFQNGLA